MTNESIGKEMRGPTPGLQGRIEELPPPRRALAAALLKARAAASPYREVSPRRLTEEAAPDSRAFPLSFAQQRLWFLDRLTPGRTTYNAAIALRVASDLDRDVLVRCLEAVLRRHTVLQATYPISNSQPVQVLPPRLHISLPVVDLQGLSPSARTSQVEAITEAQVKKPFSLTEEPALRLVFASIQPGEDALVLIVHHIAADGSSLSLLVRELGLYCEAAIAGVAPAVPELPLQYTDFAVWQRKALLEGAMNADLHYWRTQLRDLPVLDLPLDHARPPVSTGRGGRMPLTCAGLRELRSLSRQESATLFMTLLAALQTLLSRHTGSTDIHVGALVSNRNLPGTESLIGMFLNTLVLRTDLSGDPTFRVLLRRVREVVRMGYAHQDLPFDKLVDELRPVRALNQQPLFDVLLDFQQRPVNPFDHSTLQLSPAVFRRGPPRSIWNCMLRTAAKTSSTAH